jgi:hypothetical protein
MSHASRARALGDLRNEQVRWHQVDEIARYYKEWARDVEHAIRHGTPRPRWNLRARLAKETSDATPSEPAS